MNFSWSRNGSDVGYFFLSRAEDEVVVARSTGEATFEEGDVEEGRVVVDELEDVELESETAVVFRLRP